MALTIVPSPALLFPAPTPTSLLAAFLEGRSPRTLAAYRADLGDFCRFLGASTLEEASAAILSRPHGAANALALAYRANLLDRQLAPATVNRRLAALRSLSLLARTLGLVSWRLEVPSIPTQPYRDTRGLGRHAVRRLLHLLETPQDPKRRRDRAMLRLLHDLGLRREEVVSLDLEHVNLDVGSVAVLGKGRRERERLTLPEPTTAALRDWIAVRGSKPGPLFLNFDRAGKGRRLTGTSLYRIVHALGASLGLDLRPHGIRHAAITEALDVTGGDVRAVQRFSRHRDVRTLLLYDDARQDLGGDIARRVVALI